MGGVRGESDGLMVARDDPSATEGGAGQAGEESAPSSVVRLADRVIDVQGRVTFLWRRRGAERGVGASRKSSVRAFLSGFICFSSFSLVLGVKSAFCVRGLRGLHGPKYGFDGTMYAIDGTMYGVGGPKYGPRRRDKKNVHSPSRAPLRHFWDGPKYAIFGTNRRPAIRSPNCRFGRTEVRCFCQTFSRRPRR